MIRLALLNIFRRKLRNAITAFGIAIAIGMLYTLFAFDRGYQKGLTSELDRLGAHVLVVPKGCPYDAASIALHGASWPCYLKDAYLKEVAANEGVATAAPILMNATWDEKTESQVVYCGITDSMLKLRRHWQPDAGDVLPSKGLLIAGSSIAKSNGWTVGQTVSLPGIKNQTLKVGGILKPTASADDAFIHISMADAQRIFKRPNALTHILVQLKDPNKVDDVVNELRGCDAGLEMTVVPLAHLFTTIRGLIQATRVLLGCITLTAMLAAAAGVANTILMAVAERTREIGILRAIGTTRATVVGQLVLEAVLLCTAGGLGGVLTAMLTAPLAEASLRSVLPYAPADPMLGAQPVIAILCCLLGPVIGAVAGMLPALRAAALQPSLALREVL
jgi:putative ABC transport system permease protein